MGSAVAAESAAIVVNVLPKTDRGNELWLDMHGKFKRWVDAAYFRGEVPAEWGWPKAGWGAFIS